MSKPITPRQYAIKTGNTVIVYSNGQAYMSKDGQIIPIAEDRISIEDGDLENIYYPDGTSEWEHCLIGRYLEIKSREIK